MTRNKIVSAALALFTIGLALMNPAMAQAPEQRDAPCHGGDGITSEQQIAGCTELIESPDRTPHDRAVAHILRGSAYRLQHEYDRAAADYDQAFKLAPETRPLSF
jgi:tetratricopeptide (TPR) repeat protein